MNALTLLSGLVLALLMAIPGQGDLIVYTGQNRFVRASAWAQNENEFDSDANIDQANNLLDWSANTGASATLFSGGSPSAGGNAYQSSTLRPLNIIVDFGHAQAFAQHFGDLLSPQSYAEAESFFQVDFVLNCRARFEVDNLASFIYSQTPIDADPQTTATAFAGLFGNGWIWAETVVAANNSVLLNLGRTDVLEPGAYSLVASSFASAYSEGSNAEDFASADFEFFVSLEPILAVPEPTFVFPWIAPVVMALVLVRHSRSTPACGRAGSCAH